MTVLAGILTVIFVVISILLIFMVVITPSKEGGLASAFGGMGSDSFFGTKAQSHISRFTIFLAVSFIVLAILINLFNAHSEGDVDGGGKFNLPAAGDTPPPDVPVPSGDGEAEPPKEGE